MHLGYLVPPARRLFHFGGRWFAGNDRAGYFLDRTGQILCIRPDGSRIGTWRSFHHFLEDELATAEKFWARRQLFPAT